MRGGGPFVAYIEKATKKTDILWGVTPNLCFVMASNHNVQEKQFIMEHTFSDISSENEYLYVIANLANHSPIVEMPTFVTDEKT